MSGGASTGSATARGLLFEDDFSAALLTGTTDARWRLRPVGPLPSGDGIVTTGRDGLVVVPTATDAKTGNPAFADAPQPLGDADHLRWTLMANHTSGAKFPGFDTGDDSRLEVSALMSVTGYGLERHPYGDAVSDAGRDLRLGAGMLICVDLETGIVFDFIVTDRCVFAVYERLALAGTSHGAFSYAVPVADRQPDDLHSLTIRYAADSAAAHWYVGGSEVLRVDGLGLRSVDPQYLKRDNGRPEKAAFPRQMTFGVGLFADRLFGQGFRLTVRGFQVRDDGAGGASSHAPGPDQIDAH